MIRRRVRRILVALLLSGTIGLSGAIGLSTGIAYADHTPTPFFLPPPGCTGDWNTAQSAANNHAPGTSPGCAKILAGK